MKSTETLRVVPARYPLRLVGAAIALFILAVVIQSVAFNPRWEWSVFAHWFFHPAILSGLGQTLLLTLIVVLIILYNFSYLYDTLSIGIPFTALTLAEYHTIDVLGQFSTAVIGLTLVQAAYSAEIIRGGMLGVDQGQFEATADGGGGLVSDYHHRSVRRSALC